MGGSCSLRVKGCGGVFGVGVGDSKRPDVPGQAGWGAVGWLSLQRDMHQGSNDKEESLPWLGSMLLGRGSWQGGHAQMVSERWGDDCYEEQAAGPAQFPGTSLL